MFKADDALGGPEVEPNDEPEVPASLEEEDTTAAPCGGSSTEPAECPDPKTNASADFVMLMWQLRFLRTYGVEAPMSESATSFVDSAMRGIYNIAYGRTCANETTFNAALVRWPAGWTTAQVRNLVAALTTVAPTTPTGAPILSRVPLLNALTTSFLECDRERDPPRSPATEFYTAIGPFLTRMAAIRGAAPEELMSLGVLALLGPVLKFDNALVRPFVSRYVADNWLTERLATKLVPLFPGTPIYEPAAVSFYNKATPSIADNLFARRQMIGSLIFDDTSLLESGGFHTALGKFIHHQPFLANFLSGGVASLAKGLNEFYYNSTVYGEDYDRGTGALMLTIESLMVGTGLGSTLGLYAGAAKASMAMGGYAVKAGVVCTAKGGDVALNLLRSGEAVLATPKGSVTRYFKENVLKQLQEFANISGSAAITRSKQVVAPFFAYLNATIKPGLKHFSVFIYATAEKALSSVDKWVKTRLTPGSGFIGFGHVNPSNLVGHVTARMTDGLHKLHFALRPMMRSIASTLDDTVKTVFVSSCWFGAPHATLKSGRTLLHMFQDFLKKAGKSTTVIGPVGPLEIALAKEGDNVVMFLVVTDVSSKQIGHGVWQRTRLIVNAESAFRYVDAAGNSGFATIDQIKKLFSVADVRYGIPPGTAQTSTVLSYFGHTPDTLLKWVDGL